MEMTMILKGFWDKWENEPIISNSYSSDPHKKLTKNIVVLWSIGFLGPTFALLGLNVVNDPTVATTCIADLSAFTQSS
jgi:hypothetical protein